MNFNPNNFIKPYNNTDKYISILYDNNKTFRVLNICQHNKLLVNNKLLSILQEGGKSIDIKFNTNQDAIIGRNNLQNAIDTLSDNCKISEIIIPPGSQTIIPVTYQEYKNLQSTNSLGVLQYYDVSDVNSDLINGGFTFRILSLNSTDSNPQGVVLNDKKQLVSFNCINDNIIYYIDGKQDNYFYNSKFSINDYNDITNIYAINSNLILQDLVNGVKSFFSNLTINECENIYSVFSNIKLKNCINLYIFNITDLSSQIYEYYNDVTINNSNSIGKIGKDDLDIVPSLHNFIAYKTLTNQVIDNINKNIEINLKNEFKEANAEFNLKIKDINYNITIKDGNDSNSTLIVLNSSNSNSDIKLYYNKSTNKWEYEQLYNPLPTKQTITVTTNGQTTFSNVLNKIPSNTTNIQLFVNGKSETKFNISGKTLIFQNTEYILETTDTIYILYY